jgi:hypothetical protein
MKVVFLDFDGVIIPVKAGQGLGSVDAGCIERVNRILRMTGAKVVISSSWRHLGDGDADFMRVCSRIEGEIIGQTPTGINRSAEIVQWLITHGLNGDCVIESFVVLDDDRIVIAGARDSIIQTNPSLGLQEFEADTAIRILNVKTCRIDSVV